MYSTSPPKPPPLPSAIHSESTLIGSSGLQYAQSRPFNQPFTLTYRSAYDFNRANWEVKWGIVKERQKGDWVLVKWVTSSHPVFRVEEILVMAIDILSERSNEYPDTDDLEKLLMWILEDMLRSYGMDDKVLHTLVHCNVGNRYQNIESGSTALE